MADKGKDYKVVDVVEDSDSDFEEDEPLSMVEAEKTLELNWKLVASILIGFTLAVFIFIQSVNPSTVPKVGSKDLETPEDSHIVLPDPEDHEEGEETFADEENTGDTMEQFPEPNEKLFDVDEYMLQDVDWLEANVPWPTCTPSSAFDSTKYLMTSASANHFKELSGWVENKQSRMSDKYRIIVFDLGLEPQQVEEIKTWCNVKYVKYNWQWMGFAPDTPWEEIERKIMGLTNCAWKPLAILYGILHIIAEGRGCGQVAYMDTSIELTPIFFTSNAILNAMKAGVYPLQSPTFGLAKFIHHTSLEILSNITGYTYPDNASYLHTPVIRGGFTLWQPSEEYGRKNFLWPLIKCMRNITCVAPPGASGFTHNPTSKAHVCRRSATGEGTCHRGDQAIMSTLFSHMLRLGDWPGATPITSGQAFKYLHGHVVTLKETPTYLRVQRSPTGKNAKTCKKAL